MDKFKFTEAKNIKKLPKTSGVYCFINGKDTIYIGKAINIQNRVKNHFQQPTHKDNLFINKIDKIGYLKTDSEIEALILEANLIKKYQPKFNVVWRDDKNYFYVAILQNKNSIPYVFITHHPNLKFIIQNSKFYYIGPFVEGTALKNALKYLRKVFPYYTSAKHSKNKCAYCHLELCPGPNPDLKYYKKNINKLILVLKGKSNTVLSSLKKEMNHLSKENKFEEAGYIRDKIYSLQQVMSHKGVIQPGTNLEIPPFHRIECYDVSNIQGKFATGSMVVFIDGKPNKNEYRKFKIKIKNTPNDIAMLKETLERRFNHPEWKYPEIILIDGGKAQLNVAIRSKKNLNLKVLSIAKGKQDPLRPRSEARLFIEGRNNPIPLKDLPQGVRNLILQLDSEAHRFAISYHKKLRKHNLLQ
jgi:excinuclease ABC subunit C